MERRISMHEGIGTWCDCCSCEAEPRWLEVAAEMGIELSDYEENNVKTGVAGVSQSVQAVAQIGLDVVDAFETDRDTQ